MLFFISPKNEVNIRKERVKMYYKNVFLVILLTKHSKTRGYSESAKVNVHRMNFCSFYDLLKYTKCAIVQ